MATQKAVITGKETVNPNVATLLRTNRYRNAVYWDDGPKSIVIREKEHSVIPERPSDSWHTVDAYTTRLDQISYKYYFSYAYWWVIAYANHIDNPLIPLPIGAVIRVPDLVALETAGYFA